jgi:hypothetical protein
MADGKGNLSEIDSMNIIIAKLMELLEESRKASRRTGKVRWCKSKVLSFPPSSASPSRSPK